MSLSVQHVLTRQVEEVLPERKGLAALMQKRKIRVYLGIDPTGRNLHLGHTIPLRKLQQFADLGHEAILVVGTGTVLAGDPSQRSEARARITQQEIEENIRTWKKQVSGIIDFKKVKVRKNGEWLTKLRLPDILDIASRVSAAQLFQRDMFQKRLERGGTVWTHELLYPLLQGYDSVALDTDAEIGGTDQTFNMLVGRELQRKMRNREKFVLTTPMVVGLDGKQMSKTSGNTVDIASAPEDMYGKLMTLHDGLVLHYFEMLTDVPMAEAEKLKRQLSPRDFKAQLALTLVEQFHGRAAAEKAEHFFTRLFREKQLPEDIPAVKVQKRSVALSELLVKARLAESRSDARRAIAQGGVRVNGKAVRSDEALSPESGMVLQRGKRRFARIA